MKLRKLMTVMVFGTMLNTAPALAADTGLQAVVFDWAGTVQDYGSVAPMVVFRKVFAEKGVEITVEEARAPMGSAKKDHIRAITKLTDVEARWKKVHGRKPTEKDVEEMYARFIPLQCECLKEYSTLIPGTLETAQFIRQHGWKIGSSTGYSKEMQEIIGTEAAKQGFKPDTAVTADMVPKGRPKPYMVFKNCSELGVPTSHTVVVDDTIPGIRAGNKAGAWTIHVFQTGNEVGLSEDELAKLPERKRNKLLRKAQTKGEKYAHYVLPSVAELPAYLDQIDALIKQGFYPHDFSPENPPPAPKGRLS